MTALEWTDFEQNRATIKDGAIHFIQAVLQELFDIYVTDGSDRSNACLMSVLHLSVDKSQV